MDDRLFDMNEIPEVPLLREPRGRRGAAVGSARDARFLNDYPPEWDRCQTCDGDGGKEPQSRVRVVPGTTVVYEGVERTHEGGSFEPSYGDWPTMHMLSRDGKVEIVRGDPEPCPDCLGMGSIKARVRLEAGHRCVRCLHPYIPKGDAKKLQMISPVESLGVVALVHPEPSGLHDCETCSGAGWTVEAEHDPSCNGDCTDCPVPVQVECDDCKGTGKRWTPWSACDERCTHGGPIRVRTPNWNEVDADGFRGVGDGWVEDTAKHIDREPGAYLRDGHEVEAIWRILTVHHLDGDKANLRWWNLVSLCQRCHLEIQAKVVMERVYPHEHSEWFRPYAAGYYAWVYNGEELSRPEVMARLDELLGLELAVG